MAAVLMRSSMATNGNKWRQKEPEGEGRNINERQMAAIGSFCRLNPQQSLQYRIQLDTIKP
ncbi:MAG: hypothetical protein D6698_02795 [Gammaproteobacteria bacterium]|nr:MAG: hypothetical protein D6698_02795 [Gammaproteobacteria bacterium]